MHNDDGDDALSSSLTSQRRHQFSLYHEKIRIKQQTIKVVHILKKVMIYAHTQTHHCFFTTHKNIGSKMTGPQQWNITTSPLFQQCFVSMRRFTLYTLSLFMRKNYSTNESFFCEAHKIRNLITKKPHCFKGEGSLHTGQ